MDPERTLSQWLAYGKDRLRKCGIEEYDSDAWLLFECAFSCSRKDYSLHLREKAKEEKVKRYLAFIKKRAEHVPVQYIIGKTWFYGYSFLVNPYVLIPRQDTETLVECALERLKPGQTVLDVCTGSGCILLTVMKEAGVVGTGTDLSKAALLVAEENGRRLGVTPCWIHSDLFEQVEGNYDMILSNPPYIASAVLETLEPEVKDHEPRMALDGDKDGLYFYRKITAKAPNFLNEGGWLLLEIGYDQGEAVQSLLTQRGFDSVEIRKDLQGMDRVATGQWNHPRRESYV